MPNHLHVFGDGFGKPENTGRWILGETATLELMATGKRIRLAPGDWYAYGADRGGIDERWFASTTEAAN